MKNDLFHFKQFVVQQDKCAMKVGTDSVLLGAWAEGGKRILDIGSGTGVLSLMMAQRFPEARVEGVELDGDAFEQAVENARQSLFVRQIQFHHCPVQDFHSGKFDSIVSNPPFFVDSLKSPDSLRNQARHSDSLSFHDLFMAVKRLLSDGGVFSAIIPKDCLELFETEAYHSGLFITRKIEIKTTERKAIKRVLLAFRYYRSLAYEQQIVCLLDKTNECSEWYYRLTKDFYVR